MSSFAMDAGLPGRGPCGRTGAPRPRRLALAALACFAVRLGAAVLAIRSGSFLQHDGQDYLELARNLGSFRGYLVERVRWFEPPREVPASDFSRPPLVPLALGAIFAVLPDSIFVAAAFQAAVGTLVCLACAAAARAFWGDRAYWPALVLSGAYPVFVYYSAHLSTEAMMSLLLAADFAALKWLAEGASNSRREALLRAAGCGALLGLSALCRPTMLVGFAFVPLWALVFLNCPIARRACVSSVMLLAAGAIVAPWTARIALASGEFVPITNVGGYVFWLGNNEDALRAYASSSYAEFLEREAHAFGAEGSRLVAEMARRGIESPADQQRFWFEEGLAFVRGNPGGYLFLLCMRLGHFFRPWPNPAAYGALAAVALAAMWCVLYAAAAAGLARLWRLDRAAAAAVVAVVMSGAAAHALTLVMLRHRSPFVDTAALVLAAPVLVEWAGRLAGRIRGPALERARPPEPLSARARIAP